MDVPVSPDTLKRSGESAQRIPAAALATLSTQKLEGRHLTWTIHIGAEKASLLLTWVVDRKKGTKSKLSDRRQKRTTATASVPGPEKRKKKSDTQRRRNQRRRALFLARQNSPAPAPSPKVVGSVQTAPSTTRPPPPLPGRSSIPRFRPGRTSRTDLPGTCNTITNGDTTARVSSTSSDSSAKTALLMPNQRPCLGPNQTARLPAAPAMRPHQPVYPGIKYQLSQHTTRRPSGTITGDVFFYARQEARYVLYRPSHGLLVRCYFQANINDVTPANHHHKSLTQSQLEGMYPHYQMERVTFNTGGDIDTLSYIYYQLEEAADEITFVVDNQ